MIKCIKHQYPKYKIQTKGQTKIRKHSKLDQDNSNLNKIILNNKLIYRGIKNYKLKN